MKRYLFLLTSVLFLAITFQATAIGGANNSGGSGHDGVGVGNGNEWRPVIRGVPLETVLYGVYLDELEYLGIEGDDALFFKCKREASKSSHPYLYMRKCIRSALQTYESESY